jgi:hypothetical protein
MSSLVILEQRLLLLDPRSEVLLHVVELLELAHVSKSGQFDLEQLRGGIEAMELEGEAILGQLTQLQALARGVLALDALHGLDEFPGQLQHGAHRGGRSSRPRLLGGIQEGFERKVLRNVSVYILDGALLDENEKRECNDGVNAWYSVGSSPSIGSGECASAAEAYCQYYLGVGHNGACWSY